MPAPSIHPRVIGPEGQMLVVIDDFARDPEALREAAARATFEAAGEHYPGIRAALPPGYMAAATAVLRPILAGIFGRHGGSSASRWPSTGTIARTSIPASCSIAARSRPERRCRRTRATAG